MPEWQEGISSYLKEIGKTPLLTREQEFELAERIENGDQEAKEEFARANLRLVVSMARKTYYHSSALTLLDLIQEGNVGLMKAIEKFDRHKGYKFSTYATWWIWQAVWRAISKHGRDIRLPSNILDSIYRAKKQICESRDKGESPRDLREILKEDGLSDVSIEGTISATRGRISLDAEIGEDGETFEEYVDGRQSSQDDEFREFRKREIIEEAINKALNDRERNIINLRFGMDGTRGLTLQEVSVLYDGLSRERIRQIEKTALSKIRHCIETKYGKQMKDIEKAFE